MTKDKTDSGRRWWRTAIIILCLVLAAKVLLWLGFIWYYHDKIYPGVVVGDLAVGGLPLERAKILVNSQAASLKQGVSVECGNQAFVLPPIVGQVAADSLAIYNFDFEQTWRQVSTYGRRGDWWQQWQQRWQGLVFGWHIPWSVTAEQPLVKKFLAPGCAGVDKPLIEAGLVYRQNSWQIVQEQTGAEINYDQGAGNFYKILLAGGGQTLKLPVRVLTPSVTAAAAGALIPLAEERLKDFNFNITYQQQTWPVSREDGSTWLGVNRQAGGYNLDFSPANIEQFLAAKIAPQVEAAAQPAKFQVNNDRIKILQPARSGRQLDLSVSAQTVLTALVNRQTSGELVVKEVKADNSNDDQAVLADIQELVGVGTSSFAGSPVNRIHNIKVGAAALNGLIIQPGEEFSTIQALAPISAAVGYLPELVIKGNKTEPEVGGGLCQIGTTMFRVAVDAGLPITERRNHSYRVVYYEPAGTDATIYDPEPDLKFSNDTGKALLLQTRVSGSILTFELWGTRDGRQVVHTKPIIYNIVAPLPAKTTETTDLKPGEKKCSEGAHNGADAYFDYNVTYADGMIKQHRFYSHYVPWQAVCLVGVEQLCAPDGVATSTATSTAQ